MKLTADPTGGLYDRANMFFAQVTSPTRVRAGSSPVTRTKYPPAPKGLGDIYLSDGTGLEPIKMRRG